MEFLRADADFALSSLGRKTKLHRQYITDITFGVSFRLCRVMGKVAVHGPFVLRTIRLLGRLYITGKVSAGLAGGCTHRKAGVGPGAKQEVNFSSLRGGSVFDPFLGAGFTLVAADTLGATYKAEGGEVKCRLKQ